MKMHAPVRNHSFLFTAVCVFGVAASGNALLAQDSTDSRWTYRPEQLRPFWLGDVVESESVLFVRDPKTGEARASLLFPVQNVIVVRNSAADVTYQEGVDFRFQQRFTRNRDTGWVSRRHEDAAGSAASRQIAEIPTNAS